MADRSHRQKGISQVAQVIMWAVGIAVPFALAAVGADMKTNTNQDEKIYGLNADVAGLKQEVARIPIVEAKVDKLLENQNVDPKVVERAVANALSAKN